MATQITAIRTERAPGAIHDHISYVLTADNRVLSRAEVIQRITNGWESFMTYVHGNRAGVYVRRCPFCYANDYITTTPDGTVDNNLLHLPRF